MHTRYGESLRTLKCIIAIPSGTITQSNGVLLFKNYRDLSRPHFEDVV